MRIALPVLCSLLLAACGDSTNNTSPGDAGADRPAADVSTMDDAAADAAPADAAADAPAGDSGPARQCGMMRPDLSAARGSEGIVIARDGTIYYTQSRAVGRIPPGGAANNAWVAIPATGSVWGLAIDAMRQRLYVGTSGGTIYRVNLMDAMPTAESFVTGAGAANGLTMSPDNTLYYTDFQGGHVYRVDPDGMRTRVSTASISGANGLAFLNPTTLYVDSYGAGRIWRLTVADGMETGREMVASGLGSPDGLALDAMGNLYITDQRMGRLVRVAPDGQAEDLQSGMTAPANVAFGSGALSCSDIYIATGGGLRRFEGMARGASVPWN